MKEVNSTCNGSSAMQTDGTGLSLSAGLVRVGGRPRYVQQVLEIKCLRLADIQPMTPTSLDLQAAEHSPSPLPDYLTSMAVSTAPTPHGLAQAPIPSAQRRAPLQLHLEGRRSARSWNSTNTTLIEIHTPIPSVWVDSTMLDRSTLCWEVSVMVPRA